MRCWTAVACIAAAGLLSGCVTTKPITPATPSVPGTRDTSAKLTPVPSVPPSAPVAPAAMKAPKEGFWNDLRSHLRMHDCAPDPPIQAWVHRYARWPRNFENRLKKALPVIQYIDHVALHYRVPAEFVFLPWVESHYKSVAPRPGQAAGMWQIMPITARALKLQVNAAYDERLDKVAATDAVMRMLSRYHSTFHDWRLVDMAFNAGKYRLLHATDGHSVPATPVIPDIQIARATRLHLAKLMAMACIVRHPEHHGITLPQPEASRQLRDVVVGTPVTMSMVARLSGVPLPRVRELNGAYRHGHMPTGAPHHVLLPASGATAFSSAIVTTGTTQKHSGTSSHRRAPSHYTVTAGDSLWSIAKRFGTTVHQLEQLNHLQTATLQPGQQLRVKSAYH